jgi:hypothetical protein
MQLENRTAAFRPSEDTELPSYRLQMIIPTPKNHVQSRRVTHCSAPNARALQWEKNRRASPGICPRPQFNLDRRPQIHGLGAFGMVRPADKEQRVFRVKIGVGQHTDQKTEAVRIPFRKIVLRTRADLV